MLIRLFFLIHGDGHYACKLYFVNKNAELHQFVLEQFEDIFKIPRGLWRARVLISDLAYASSAKACWKRYLSLEDSQFYNPSQSRFHTSSFGNLRIIIDNSIVSEIFKSIFVSLRIDTTNSLAALNGLLAAEGGAQIGTIGLHKLTLSFNKSEKVMFQRILNYSGLCYSVEQNKDFVIRGWENHYLFFKKFLSHDVIPFDLHSQRRARAVYGFLRHRFTQTALKYLSVLCEHKSLTVKEYSKLLNIRSDSILSTFKKRRYLQFVTMSRNETVRSQVVISLSCEGKFFLDLISKLKEVSMKLPLEEVKRNVVVKKEADTDQRFGRLPEHRSVEQLIQYGVVNLNKPSGPSSHQVSDYVQRILGITKAGHSGTLEHLS